MIRSLRRRIRGRERETPTPAGASSPGPTREATAIEIAANDPLLPYLQDAGGAVEIDSLELDSPELDSPALCELRAESSSRRGSSRAAGLAWATCMLTTAIAVARLVLAITDPASSSASSAPQVPGGGIPVAAFEALVLTAFAVVGALVASRQPRNAVGWIICAIPLSLGLLILQPRDCRLDPGGVAVAAGDVTVA